MTTRVVDRWASWLLERRDGGDATAREATLRRLQPTRDKVLDGAAPEEGDVLLDVGCGDGLIAFAALDRVGPTGRVVFSDVSQDLLEHWRVLAEDLGVVERCEFVLARAEDLAPIDDASVDAVTTRSVVIYVAEKQRAFDAFFRVLRPGGRLSLWEPINRFGHDPDGATFAGFDATPVLPLLRKLNAVAEPAAAATLIDFDERDLVRFAENAGFATIRLDYTATVERAGGLGWDGGDFDWEQLLRIAPNPHALTLEEALERALTPAERVEFEAFVRPRFEARAGTSRSAFAHLVAVKR